eukprot:Pgem_evm1s6753
MSSSKTFKTGNLNNQGLKEWISLLNKRTKEDKVVLSKKTKFASLQRSVSHFFGYSNTTTTSSISTLSTAATASRNESTSDSSEKLPFLEFNGTKFTDFLDLRGVKRVNIFAQLNNLSKPFCILDTVEVTSVEKFTVEDESDNSEDEVEEISIERVVQAELKKFENLRKDYFPFHPLVHQLRELINSKLEFLSRGNKSRIDSTTLSNRVVMSMHSRN